MLTDEQLGAIESLMDPLCELNRTAREDGDQESAAAAGDAWWILEHLLRLSNRQRARLQAELN